jgi:hypothetical protein
MLVDDLLDQTPLAAQIAVGMNYDVEPWDTVLQPDTVNSDGEDNELVCKDVWFEEDVVHDRITWLVTQVSDSDHNAVRFELILHTRNLKVMCMASLRPRRSASISMSAWTAES